MRQYYYTVASLPAIRFDEAPFLSAEEFLDYCAIEADESDLSVIRSAEIWRSSDNSEIDGAETTGDDLLDRWNTTLLEIQRSAALIRAQNIGRDADKIARPDIQDAGLNERLRQILNEENPLKTENALLRLLWQYAEALEAGHHFDREKLIVYYLKLQIAARRTRINDAAQGNEEFDRQYEEVAQSLMEIAT